MSEPVIAREVAEAEVLRWAELLGAELLGGKAPSSLVRAGTDGRIVFDEKAETFLLRLHAPIQQENGTMLGELMITEPTAMQLSEAGKGAKGEMEASVRLLSIVSGVALGVVQRIRQRDLLAALELLGFFA